jgi:hypothetical protein
MTVIATTSANPAAAAKMIASMAVMAHPLSTSAGTRQLSLRFGLREMTLPGD